MIKKITLFLTLITSFTADSDNLTTLNNESQLAFVEQTNKPNAIVVDIQINSSSDDAEESAAGNMNLTSSDLELVEEASNQKIGLRFNKIPIPPGSDIINAWIQFQVDETSSEDTPLLIQGNRISNALPFTLNNNDISNKAMTLASVSWSPVPWDNIGAQGINQRTPEIKTIIQEIVAQSKWTFGNSLSIIITGSGRRIAESYEGTQTGAPILHVEYVLPGSTVDDILFAVVGDYGSGSSREEEVSNLIDSWNPDFIITLGDNNYPDGSADTIDENIGQFYQSYINNYTGTYGQGSSTPRFFPSIGNHDANTENAQPYLDYFSLPGNERYYQFTQGKVHFFVLNSDPSEPDGREVGSIQYQWFDSAVSQSTAPFKVVYFHHAAYSSGEHGNNEDMQWPFEDFGIDVVFSGHDHTYERLLFDANNDGRELAYFVSGNGGSWLYPFVDINPESVIRYNEKFGAIKVTVTGLVMRIDSYSVDHDLVDTYSVVSTDLEALQPPENLQAVAVSNAQIDLSWTADPSNADIIGYTIRYADNSAFNQATYAFAGNQNTDTFSVTDLAANTVYYFALKIEAINDNDSIYSETLSATTFSESLPLQPLISDNLFGINAWMPHQIGNRVYFGDLEEKLCGIDYPSSGICTPVEIQASGVKLMRYGGIGVDKNYDALLSPDQYLIMVDNMRANGMEPILQVPFYDGQFDTSMAADLITFINITHQRDVKYWSIGNEPNNEYVVNTNASNIANYFKDFAVVMKNIDPLILITGPDLAWYDYGLMNDLTSPGGSDDITGSFIGTDGLPHYYLDIINFHSYPFNGSASQTREAVIDQPNNGLQNAIVDLKTKVENANSFHLRAGDDQLLIGITEINVNYQNPANDDLDGVGATSFLGGQFWAEVFNLGMKHELRFITPWSVVEGMNLGFIKNDGLKLPSYYHFQMLAHNFRGNYIEATVLNLGSIDTHLKAFAAINQDHIAVMILNQKSDTSIAYSVRLDGAPSSSGKPLQINVNLGIDSEYQNSTGEPLVYQSSLLLIFDLQGNLLRKEVYRKAVEAVQNLPPTVYSYVLPNDIIFANDFE